MDYVIIFFDYTSHIYSYVVIGLRTFEQVCSVSWESADSNWFISWNMPTFVECSLLETSPTYACFTITVMPTALVYYASGIGIPQFLCLVLFKD
jgi:hypothetical protein